MCHINQRSAARGWMKTEEVWIERGIDQNDDYDNDDGADDSDADKDGEAVSAALADADYR